TGDDVPEAERRRRRAIGAIEEALREIRRYEDILDAPVAVVGPAGRGAPTLRPQIGRLIDLADHRGGTALPPAQARLLPSPADWEAARPAVVAMAGALIAGSQRAGVLAGNPGRVLRP